MDPEKVRAVQDWPKPMSRKEVQRFSGFANFYRKFICNFSHIAAPLHALTSSKVQFSWSPQAESALQRLKINFVTALVLTPPDLKLQFMVEVHFRLRRRGCALNGPKRTLCLFVLQVFSSREEF